MSDTVKAAVKKRRRITITGEKVDSTRNVMEANAAIQRVLSRRTTAELIHYAIPTKESNVFSRLIVVAKIPKVTSDVELDIPDIEDVYDVDLPWIGQTSFKRSTRHLRSKYNLGVMVDAVREYNGYLYLLTDSRINTPRHEPIIVWETHGLYGTVHLDLDTRVDAAVFEEQFNGVEEVPVELVTELTALGYVQVGNVFSHPRFPTSGSIEVHLWGKRVPVESKPTKVTKRKVT